MFTEMGNYGEDEPNVVENCLNVDALIPSKELEDKSNEDVENVVTEMNRSDCENSEKESNEKYLVKDEDYNKDRQITEENDSEQEDTNKSNKENIEESQKSTKILSKSCGFKKKSKKERKEERMKIHSETHRLMREREISIPYHIPKQRTLREFLSRKKNRANIPLNTPSSKMLEIWKDIEESTRSAFEFFKSDSESDMENCNNNEKPGKKRKKTENKGDKNVISSVKSNSHLGSIADEENLSDNIIKETENIDKVDITITKKDDNALFICENAVIEPDDLVNSDDKCLENRQGTEGSRGAGNNESSSYRIVHLNQTQKDITEINIENEDEKTARERTSEWVKNIPTYEMMLRPNKKEMLLQKLNPKLLSITPKLTGTPDSIIDLESEKKGIEIGAKNLKKRFLENCLAPRNKPKADVELTITTSEKGENGEISVATEKLIYSSPEVLKDPDLDKPGAKLQRLREELKKKIEAKWEEENRKKMEEMVENKNKKLSEEEVEEEEELIDDDKIIESDGSSKESEPEEDDILMTEKKTTKNQYIDSEAEESDYDEEQESGNEGGDEEDDDDGGEESRDLPEKQQSSVDADVFPVNGYSDSQSSLIPPYQPGGGMLHGGSELTQNDGDISLPKNVLSPALRLSLDLSSSTKNDNSLQPWDIDLESSEESNTKSNFVPCFPENRNFDLNDAYEFCSGKFPGEGGYSQDVPFGETNTQGFVNILDNESQLNSNTFDGLTVTNNDTPGGSDGDERKKKKRSRLIIPSDDSDEEREKATDDMKELEDITERKVSLDDSGDESVNSLPVRNKGTRKNLVFSDEEDDLEMERKTTHDSDESDEENSSQNEEEDPFADEVGREVVYDSEENEIVNPREYLDKEAELSGSEWSGDEDERGLDEFEEEDGDADKLDERKIRSQLEKMHMRTLLDDDEREVRLLQEILFEDGDLFDDGPKREKNFRWKDLGNFFDDDDNDGNDGEKTQDQEDMEEDEQSRQSRHEKELFLLKMKNRREKLGLDDEDDECGISFLKRGRVVIESSSLVAKATKKAYHTVRTEPDELGFKTPFGLTNKRGSFLSRNEEFLSKLAKFTSNATENIIGPKHSKNFIFTVKSPEKEGSSSKENSQPKRKNSLQRGDHTRNKRLKLDKPTTSAKTSILDRLT